LYEEAVNPESAKDFVRYQERWIAAYPAMRLTKMFGACPAASAADPLTSVPPSPI
jgi:hypothetical protein